ncbi:hypothetical protein M3N64_04625 [Sporolactobacillus sp. CPB3-1]|uniref:LPXTG cell wall anchor domain-containing protein n=1 Tax=Sporolactobacillus mangiferae TaxID=2940498 RepID=A0ABT0M8M7_9BACL|nr:hypothetical protein [Sporolactobacillus mangiferae]MCL1631232.1 hypothetical protein [Sporolactobacillus mangiferae]
MKPLGVFEIDDQQTFFKPAVDLNFLTLMVTLVTFGLFLLLKTKKRK